MPSWIVEPKSWRASSMTLSSNISKSHLPKVYQYYGCWIVLMCFQSGCVYSVVFKVTFILQVQQAAEGVDIASRETCHFTWLSWIWIMSVQCSEGAVQRKFDCLQYWPYLWSASRGCLIRMILKVHLPCTLICYCTLHESNTFMLPYNLVFSSGI